ncbi:hypothetical protein E2C01_079281 [Portunus trituberculatus]|uniref:Uncharacterized protein n=1 Tax=Portunus trituberculatus TaxID=210409 RepID=A0A5B7IGK1_PORTR|nr:hypothetical protein [Portunus trituberculatus]
MWFYKGLYFNVLLCSSPLLSSPLPSSSSFSLHHSSIHENPLSSPVNTCFTQNIYSRREGEGGAGMNKGGGDSPGGGDH